MGPPQGPWVRCFYRPFLFESLADRSDLSITPAGLAPAHRLQPPCHYASLKGRHGTYKPARFPRTAIAGASLGVPAITAIQPRLGDRVLNKLQGYLQARIAVIADTPNTLPFRRAARSIPIQFRFGYTPSPAYLCSEDQKYFWASFVGKAGSHHG